MKSFQVTRFSFPLFLTPRLFLSTLYSLHNLQSHPNCSKILEIYKKNSGNCVIICVDTLVMYDNSLLQYERDDVEAFQF